MRLYGQHGGFEHRGGHHWIAFVFFVLLLIAIALLVVGLVRWGLAQRGAAGVAAVSSGGSDEALAMLRLRYARGEIGRDDFLVAHSDLGGGQAPPPIHAG
jgi:uncharacterized membrane protein